MPRPKNRPLKLATLLGKRVQERRLQLGLTQARLAEIVEIASETTSRIERGAVLPVLLRLEQIAITLKTGVATLLARKSLAPDDQALHLVQMLKNLEEPDRLFALNMVKRFVEHRPDKGKRGKETIAENRRVANSLPIDWKWRK